MMSTTCASQNCFESEFNCEPGLGCDLARAKELNWRCTGRQNYRRNVEFNTEVNLCDVQMIELTSRNGGHDESQ